MTQTPKHKKDCPQRLLHLKSALKGAYFVKPCTCAPKPAPIFGQHTFVDDIDKISHAPKPSECCEKCRNWNDGEKKPDAINCCLHCPCHSLQEPAWDLELETIIEYLEIPDVMKAGTRAYLKSFIISLLQKTEQEHQKEILRIRKEEATHWHKAGQSQTAKEIVDIIENGGTSDTILTIEHNGERFINERQLVKAIKNKYLPNAQ